MPFHGFADFQDCVAQMQQKENVDDPEAVCGRLKADAEKRLKLTRDEVSKLCAPCAARMEKLGLTAIAVDELGDLFKTPPTAAFTVAKLDEEQQLVFGWANVSMLEDDAPLVDLQGDMIEPAVLEKAAYDFMLHSRAANDMHEGSPVGQLVESLMLTPEKCEKMGLRRAGAPAVGLWVGFKVDVETFAKVKSGERRMFSIEGKALREEAA